MDMTMNADEILHLPAKHQKRHDLLQLEVRGCETREEEQKVNGVLTELGFEIVEHNGNWIETNIMDCLQLEEPNIDEIKEAIRETASAELTIRWTGWTRSGGEG
jgi:hypothetical protein